MYWDITERTIQDEEADGELDLYVTTPPCQSFSFNGKMQGVNDPRGKLVAASVKFIVRCKPKCVVFENVKGFSSKKFAAVKKGVTKTVASAGYEVHWRLLASNSFQVPQKRVRTFMVAIRKDCIRNNRRFSWPATVEPKVDLQDVLDPPTASDKPGRLPKGSSAKAMAKCAYKKAYDKGINPLVTPISVDVDCSEKYKVSGINIANTLTKTRGGQGGP